MPTAKNIIVLPVVGEPYIEANDYVNLSYKPLQEIVGGCIEQVNNNNWDISSMFVADGSSMYSSKWKWVYSFLKSLRINQYKLYVNDCGKMSECVNMALIYKTQDFSSLNGKMCSKEDIENCPHIIEPLFGRCAIVVNKSYITDFHNGYNHNEGYSMLQRKVLDEEYSSEEEDPYADEKAYDEYKGK
jgi:hypothetical protein